MKIIRALFLSCLLAFFTASQAQNGDETWSTIMVDEAGQMAHDVDLASIRFVNKSEFLFIHRIRFKTPVVSERLTFDSIVVMSYGNCQTRKAKILADIARHRGKNVAQNGLVTQDEPEVPAENTIHAVVIAGVCGKNPSFQI
jgi:hypothetical protein